MSLVELIDFWARHKPDAPAILTLDSLITYRTLSNAIRSVAGHISQQIFDPAAPVGILIDNPPRNIVLNLALMSLRIPSVVVRNPDVEHVRRIGGKTLMFDGPGGPTPGMTLIRIDPGWFNDPKPPPVKTRGNATRTKLSFTSGTSGMPKAISFSDDDIAGRTRYLRTVTADVLWARSLVMPGLSSNFGFSQVVHAFESGRTVSFAAPEDIAKLVELFGIDLLICSNQQAQGLCYLLAESSTRLRSLKCVWIGGAVITEALAAMATDYLCRDVIGVYASTEAHVAAFGRWGSLKQTSRAVGHICPWATVECVDDRGRPLPAGQEGRVRIRTPHQGQQYPTAHGSENEVETWFYPGDRGCITHDGLLVISGRTDETINKGGFKISAAAIDQCLVSLAGVQDAAVCAVPSVAGTDELVALLVTGSPLDIPSINAALVQAGIEATIDRVVTVDRIPRNTTGKVNRNELKLLVDEHQMARDGR